MTPRIKEYLLKKRKLLEDNDLYQVLDDAIGELSIIGVKVLIKSLKDSGLYITTEKEEDIIIRSKSYDILDEESHMIWLDNLKDNTGYYNMDNDLFLESLKRDNNFTIWRYDTPIDGKWKYIVGLVEHRNHSLGSSVNALNNITDEDIWLYAEEFEKVK